MLFQPTNITPNVLGGAENGTVDITEGLTITWQVNGNSPLVAYKIILYRNNAASTVLYTSNTQVLDTPIYPMNYKGEQQTCSTTIDAATLSTAGLSNGNEYKIGITQYYDANHLDDAHSVTISSAPVFLARASAHVSITSPAGGSTLVSYAESFIGQYYQGESYSASATYDPLEWVQWKVFDSADIVNPIYDSQKLYTQQIQLDYDGFLNGRTYIVKLAIMNSVGQEAFAEATYDVSWTEVRTDKFTTAHKLNNQSSAVKVEWNAVDYTAGEADGDYTIKDSSLILPPTTSVVWNKTNDEQMILDAPWALLMHTRLRPSPSDPNIDILSVTMLNNNTLEFSFDRTTKLLSVKGYDGTTSTAYLYADEAQLKILVTPTDICVYKFSAGYGLVPQTTLTPSAGTPGESLSGLEPSFTASQSMKLIFSITDLDAVQTDIKELEVGGRQTIDFIEVISDVTQEQEDATFAWASTVGGELLPAIKAYPNTSFLVDFDNGLDAGKYSIGGIPIVGWDVYRKRKQDAFAKHVCSLGLAQTSFLDYGCGSQMGTYTYAVYPRSDSGTYITSAIMSNDITPVFWNWSIIEAAYEEAGDDYKVINEYVFRNNVESGSVSNNNKPNVADNFTRYPTVQMSTANFQSGTLKGLIGQVGYMSYIVQKGDTLLEVSERFRIPQEKILSDNGLYDWDGSNLAGKVIRLYYQTGLVAYRDDKELRDAIWNLSTTTNSLFLKSRKGDIIGIRIAGDISMETMDATPQQAIVANVPWVQVNEAENTSIIGGFA